MNYAGLESYILFLVDVHITSQSHDLSASTAQMIEEVNHQHIVGKPKVQLPLSTLSIFLCVLFLLISFHHSISSSFYLTYKALQAFKIYYCPPGSASLQPQIYILNLPPLLSPAILSSLCLLYHCYIEINISSINPFLPLLSVLHVVILQVRLSNSDWLRELESDLLWVSLPADTLLQTYATTVDVR